MLLIHHINPIHSEIQILNVWVFFAISQDVVKFRSFMRTQKL